MPVYDYLCTACDHRTDIFHGINDPGPTFCPSCGREGTMRKQFAAPAIHYKGSGWAKKDRGGSTSTRAAAAGSKPAEGKSDDGSSGSSATPAPGGGSATGGSSGDTSSGGSSDGKD